MAGYERRREHKGRRPGFAGRRPSRRKMSYFLYVRMQINQTKDHERGGCARCLLLWLMRFFMLEPNRLKEDGAGQRKGGGQTVVLRGLGLAMLAGTTNGASPRAKSVLDREPSREQSRAEQSTHDAQAKLALADRYQDFRKTTAPGRAKLQRNPDRQTAS